MATEFLYATSHLAGDFPNPGNAVGDTPGTWAGSLNTNSSYTSRWAIGDPSEALTGAATQTVRVVARKGSNSGNPSVAVNLYENGTLVTALVASTSITSETGQTLSGTFADADVTNPANVEIEVVASHVGGNPNMRNSAQISHIEWEADVTAAGVVVQASPATLATGAQAVSPSLTGLAVQASPASLSPAAQTVNPQVAGGGAGSAYVDKGIELGAAFIHANQVDGSQWTDESGNGHHATASGAAWNTSGGPADNLPGYWSTDGLDDRLVVADHADFHDDTAITIVNWLRRPAGEQNDFCAYLAKGADNDAWMVRQNSGDESSVRFTRGGTNNHLDSATGEFQPDEWVLFMWRTAQGATTDVYKITPSDNGVAQAVITSSSEPTMTTNNGLDISYGARDTGTGYQSFFKGDHAGGMVFPGSFLSTTNMEDLYAAAFGAGGGGVTVQASPAVLTTEAQATDPQQIALTITAAPATLTTAGETATPTLAPVAIQATPAGLAMAAQTTVPTQAALATQVSPASLTSAAQTVSPAVSGAPVTVQAVPASVSTAAQTVTPAQAALSVTADPATLTSTGQPASPQQAALSVSASPATTTSSASVVDPQVATQGVTVQAAPATLTSSAQTATPTQAALTVQADPATLTVSSETVQPQAADNPVVIQAAPAVTSTTAQSSTPVLAGLVIQADPAVVSAEAQALVPSFDALVLQAVAASVSTSASVFQVGELPFIPIVVPASYGRQSVSSAYGRQTIPVTYERVTVKETV